MEFESKLLPIMREGIDIIKMIFFKKLKDHLSQKYAGNPAIETGKLTGTIVNELFGTPNTEEPFASFAEQNRDIVTLELDAIACDLEEMRIPLTDALRMQALCDHQEGGDSTPTLTRATELGILLDERDLPLPHHFMHLVRKLGSAHGLIIPPHPEESTPQH